MSFRGTVPILWRATMRYRHCASVASVQMPLGRRFGHWTPVGDADQPSAGPSMKPVDKTASLTALGNTDEATSLEEPGNSDRYDNMTMFELQDELMKRRLHHIYPGRTFDDMRVRLRKAEGGSVPEHWMYDSPWTPPTPDKSRDAPPTLEAHEIWALQMTPLVEVCKQRGLCTHVLPYDMRTRLQALESGQQVPREWLARFKSPFKDESGYNSLTGRQLQELLRERGLKGRWLGFTNAEMASRLRVSDECLPHQIPKRWRLKEAPTYFASARAELYNGLTKAEIDLVLKARGLRSLGHKENVDDAIRCLVACDKGEAIDFRWLALGITHIHDIDSAKLVQNIKSQRTAAKPVYSRLSSLDPSASPLAAAADDAVAKRARDYDAMFTYQHIVSMCKQEGLRWQAAGLSARVVNIRKDILCYRLALKEAAHVEEDWLLESLDIPKYAAKPKPDSERAARPQITNRGESSIDYAKLSFVALRLAVRGRGLSVLPDEELMAFKLMAHEHKGKLPESWFGPFGRQYYAHQPRVIELKNLGKDELVTRLRAADIPAVTRQDLVNKLIKS